MVEYNQNAGSYGSEKPGWPGDAEINTADNWKSALELVKQQKPHVIFLDVSKADYDFWQYIDSRGKTDTFRGEYMTQYSWAEKTLGTLL